jgi:hypothetical protein
MVPLSRLGKQVQEVLDCLARINVPSALIGGLALAPYKVIRATQDIDLLADADRADAVDRELQTLGYSCLHRSSDAGNYVRGDERVDFLYASRPAARRLLAEAKSHTTLFGTLRVISLEGLIAFKLQGLVNDPSRTRDLEDIRALLQMNRDVVNLDEVREYFRLFDREALLDEILSTLP